MNGLAQRGADNSTAALLAQVVEMLKQGATPEELVQQGVPVEVIQAAIEVLQEEVAMQSIPTQDAGLAARKVTNGL